ncbi:MAG: toxin-antitoxin system HicB family antitoxin [Anaerolineae bacterium]|jgi:predicted transcriptional regulator|nr:toxin-antitoxin system HicB family antitoxin [Anaerolineae bacterium]
MAEVKRITIRISPALHRRLHQAADVQEMSLNKLAVRALETYVEEPTAGQERLPLRELSALLAPAAEGAELTEEELLQHARQVRRRIWQERYEKAVQAITEQQDSP